MNVSPDSIIYARWGFFTLNATIVFTWAVMGLLLIVTLIATRRISTGPSMTRWQNLLETVVSYMRDQIREIMNRDPDRFLPFVGTLFLFIAVSNVLTIVPYYQPPTGSLLTTSALALCVFFAVPIYGISEKGLGYFKRYVKPTPFMLPFNIIGELSRTLALAVRLFGNIMSGSMIVAIIIGIVPFFLPIVMQALGLLIGLIQAYIFAVLATVYIGSALQVRDEEDRERGEREG